MTWNIGISYCMYGIGDTDIKIGTSISLMWMGNELCIENETNRINCIRDQCGSTLLLLYIKGISSKWMNIKDNEMLYNILLVEECNGGGQRLSKFDCKGDRTHFLFLLYRVRDIGWIPANIVYKLLALVSGHNFVETIKFQMNFIHTHFCVS